MNFCSKEQKKRETKEDGLGKATLNMDRKEATGATRVVYAGSVWRDESNEGQTEPEESPSDSEIHSLAQRLINGSRENGVQIEDYKGLTLACIKLK